jgi:hypothetical protein
VVPTLAKSARMGRPQVVVIHGAEAMEPKRKGGPDPPSFFEGWDSTVVSRVRFLADSCSALLYREHRLAV